MNKIVVQKLKKIPKAPGVYLYRNDKNRVIYVGKAINLKNRVTSYFHGEHDGKTEELVKNIFNIEWIEVESEFEALILEADLIKRYKPKYNIRLRDDKGYSYLKISKENYPQVAIVKQITDPVATYLGPFTETQALKSVLKTARYIYPFCTCGKQGDEICLYYHLKLCPGHSEKYISPHNYQRNIKGLVRLFSGKTKKIELEIKLKMKKAAENREYEKAAEYRNKLGHLKKIQHAKLFSDRELSDDAGLRQLGKELNLAVIPKRIECFDISNIMGTAAVGSMVVFINGIASPKDYRRFQIKTVKGANDFASMAEVLRRRFVQSQRSKPDHSFAELPNLVILDGGKGQLSAVLENVEIPAGIEIVALAKKFETIYLAKKNKPEPSKVQTYQSGPISASTKIEFNNSELIRNSKFKIINLRAESEALFLVQRIRDEAHRFAITYHRNLRGRELYETSLDSILGVGPKTKKKLISHFGSINKIKNADMAEISKVTGDKLARKIKEAL